MRRAIQVYALSVCFFTMGCLAITTGLALWNGLKIAAPGMTLSEYEFRAHQSDDAYLEYLNTKYSCKIKNKQYTLPNRDEVTAIREKEYAELITAGRYSAINSLLFQLIIIIVDLIVYWFHWRIVLAGRVVSKPAMA